MMKIKNAFILVFLIIHTAFFPGCFPEEEPDLSETPPSREISGIKIIDIEGRRVTLRKKAQRIVDLTGLGGTRILIQLEAAHYVVGMTDAGLSTFNPESTTYHPAQRAFPSMIDKAVTNVGSWKEPNAEKIIALNPDVLLVGWGGKESAEKITQQTGIPSVCIGRMDGRFDYDRYRILGKIIGKEQKAADLIAYLKNKVAGITHVTDTIPDKEKKRVFFWIVPRADSDLRSNGIYDAIGYAGGINVASTKNGTGLYETSKEQVVAWNPDYIFLQSSCKKGVRESDADYLTIERVCKDPVLGAVNAVKNRQVYYLRGPRSDWDTAVQATEVFYMAKLLYPEKFKSLDVMKQGNDIFRELYRVDNLYADMSANVGLHVW